MPSHVFIDIEALGRKPGCAPIELGAVVFEPQTGEITDEFHRIIHPHGALKGERETLDWHAERGSYPFTPARYIAAERLPHVIADFLSWLPQEIDSVWSWGATYDFPVLDAAFAAIGETKEPWAYWQQECARTVWRRAFGDREHDPRPHEAMEDCRAGVRDLCDAIAALNGQRVWVEDVGPCYPAAIHHEEMNEMRERFQNLSLLHKDKERALQKIADIYLEENSDGGADMDSIHAIAHNPLYHSDAELCGKGGERE
jgi:exodeoxyribonuclease VIII